MCILIIFFLLQNYWKIFRMKELTLAQQFVQVVSGYHHLRVESWREKAKWSASKKAILFTQSGMTPFCQKLWKKDEKETEMLFVSRNQRVLICTTTAWVVLTALINFDRTTAPVDPLKSGTSTCSGLFLISQSLFPLLFSTKMSKGGEEGSCSCNCSGPGFNLTSPDVKSFILVFWYCWLILLFCDY